MKTHKQESSGEVGRVTPCAPVLAESHAARRGLTRPTQSARMTRSVLECGGKRSATPLSHAPRLTNFRQPASARKRRRRCALPAQSKIVSRLALLFCFILLHSAFILRASGQTYSIDWYKISGGGGPLSGTNYSITGTIGQPDASGAMTGGNYSMTGGFWSIYAVQTPGAPLLTITYSANKAIISWPSPATGFVLQQNSNLANTNGWSNFGGPIGDNGTIKSATNSPPVGNLFFRLKQ